MKDGRKSALKLFDDKDSADKMAEEKGLDKHYVQVRKSVPKKCLDYCSVKQFCSYGRNV